MRACACRCSDDRLNMQNQCEKTNIGTNSFTENISESRHVEHQQGDYTMILKAVSGIRLYIVRTDNGRVG